MSLDEFCADHGGISCIAAVYGNVFWAYCLFVLALIVVTGFVWRPKIKHIIGVIRLERSKND